MSAFEDSAAASASAVDDSKVGVESLSLQDGTTQAVDIQNDETVPSGGINSAVLEDHEYFRSNLPPAAILTLNKDYSTVVIMYVHLTMHRHKRFHHVCAMIGELHMPGCNSEYSISQATTQQTHLLWSCPAPHCPHRS
jgi:hypothetical protein